jgi:hypothetical protein
MNRDHLRFLICALALTACRAKAPERIPVIDVSLGDYFFHAPDTIPAGRVTFRLDAKGPHAHVMDVVRLEGGKTLKDVLAAGISVADSPWVKRLGGGVAAAEGQTTEVNMNLAPGSYLLICYFGDDDHVPHFAKGMAKPFLVTGAGSGAATPATDLEIALVDFDFALSAPLTAGHHGIRVVNSSHQRHEVVISRLKAGFTAEQGRAWADSAEAKGPIPWEMVGGVGDLAPGDTIVLQTEFRPGTYHLFCFFSDDASHKSHYELGMSKMVTIN